MNESLSRLLADLPQAEPEHARASRLRTRCHTILGARAASPRPVRRLWEPLVVGMGGLYFAGVIRDALHVYGMW